MAKKTKKVNKTTKTRTGAQFFQSDAEKKARLAAGGGSCWFSVPGVPTGILECKIYKKCPVLVLKGNKTYF